MRKWILIAIISSVVLIAATSYLYQVVRKQVTSSEFKSFTEEKISQFLRSSVKIGKIQCRLLKQISLSGLRIEQQGSHDPILIGVKKIIIRYSFWSFFKRQLQTPASIFLDSPKLQFRPNQRLWSMIMPAMIKPDRSLFSHVELDGGEAEVPIPLINQKLKLMGIRGKSFWTDDRLYLDFQAHAGGFLIGDIGAKGYLRSGVKSGNLRIYLSNSTLQLSAGILIQNLRGDIELVDSNLIIHKIGFHFRGVPCELSGSIGNIFSAYPSYMLSWRFVEEGKTFGLDTKVNFSNQSISGKLIAFDRSYKFGGNITNDETGIQLHDLLVNGEYRAYGTLNVQNSRFQLQAERGEQRFSVNLNFKNLNIDLDLNMNHLKIADHDIATLAKLKFRPLEEIWVSGKHHFDVVMETSYFIFNYHPLQDFHASLQISPSGIESIKAHWKGISQLTGSVDLSNPATSDLLFVINKFDLSNFHSLGIHEIPVTLEGELEGKIKISGLLRMPNMDGQMSVQNGKISDFDYELASVRFRGQYPRIDFHDSKINKRGKTYLLKGAVDFKLDNIVQNVKILSVDQIVMWKGWNLKKEVKSKDSLGAGIDLASASKTYEPVNSSELELEYSLKKGKSLTVLAEEEENGKRFVGVGPKLKF